SFDQSIKQINLDIKINTTISKEFQKSSVEFYGLAEKLLNSSEDLFWMGAIFAILSITFWVVGVLRKEKHTS
ncbi:hypothetical protein JXB27_00325, partial [Candidatus Woesearchaeota archaeon]|nr:hypothetical protein [Candidatus Woesearchaeota archaeon]